ncbi:hypothetical protein [Dysgonomonas sp. GY617]|uniref:hypothetical protein n=1 Tax=Dysgonomonas sp. GY617 TaxID=2780420 RepID=UPI001883DFF5|nr:hypothetical protein [Dysgonomonas sp. GY617]MBF0576047.1 hypothetical protein [Dysgonomonas sp. GY617]MBF0576270.1 hypothetical protein [Dysgonomonas sp. GY617]
MEENEVILFYSCKAWHNRDSMDLGVFTDKNAFEQYLKDMKKDKKLSNDDIKELENIGQTQGRRLNYQIMKEFLNPVYKQT